MFNRFIFFLKIPVELPPIPKVDNDTLVMIIEQVSCDWRVRGHVTTVLTCDWLAAADAAPHHRPVDAAQGGGTRP